MDPLGTKRVQASASGKMETNCTSMPFGDSDSRFTLGQVTSPTEYLFTGKERDAESELDYFPARYYGSSLGRFMSPDPSGLYMADPGNPQQLNLYAYVGNNPLRFTDPLGLSTDCGGGGDPSVVCAVTTAWNWLKSHLGSGGDSGSQNNPSAPGGGGQGPNPTDQSPPVSPLTFPNRDAAGIAAARQALIPATTPDRTNPACRGGCDYEWGGRILKDRSGQYTFTQPVTFKNSTQFFTSHVMVPFGYRKAGSYHTHPIGTTGMSSQDADWANAQHLPEYMGQAGSGQVWKYAGDNSCAAEPCGNVIYDPNHP
jgi:RHS repeat-associated protein